MNVKVETSRDGATANIDPASGMLAVKGLLVSEFLCPGRVTSRIPKASTKMLPGTLYRVYTGVGIAEPKLVNFASLVVRPTPKYFEKGMDVKRVDLGKKSELIIAVTVLEDVLLDKEEFMFEVSLLNTDKPTELAVVPTNTTADSPGLHARTVKDTQPPQADPKAAQSDAKKVTDWLNTDDGPRGTVKPVLRPVPQKVQGKAEIKPMTK